MGKKINIQEGDLKIEINDHTGRIELTEISTGKEIILPEDFMEVFEATYKNHVNEKIKRYLNK